MASYRLLTNQDLTVLNGLLMQHASTSLFMLNNVEKSQVEFNASRYEGRYFGAFINSELVAVLVQYWNGIVMAQGNLTQVAELWQKYRHEFQGIKGFVGRDDLCVLLKTQFDNEPGENVYNIDSQELLYELNLTSLKLPKLLENTNIFSRPAIKSDIDFLLPWMVDYNIEALGETPGPGLTEHVSQALVQKISERTTYVLFDADTPLATCTFNAQATPFVQIGGVWTPVVQRGKGYASSVVAAALESAQELGFKQSVLFTDKQNPAAQKAYENIGYRHAGEFGLYMLDVAR